MRFAVAAFVTISLAACGDWAPAAPAAKNAAALAPSLEVGIDSWSPGSSYVTGWIDNPQSVPCEHPVIWLDNGATDPRARRRGWIMGPLLAPGARATWADDAESDQPPAGPLAFLRKPVVTANCARPVTVGS